jgi:hypothetical protein
MNVGTLHATSLHMILDVYKNNNGNSSLGLVPIHRSQPRLFTMSDYCYSDRLFHQVETCFCNPWLSGFACYSRTFRLSFLPTNRDSGTKCLSGAGTYFPKDIVSVSDNPGPKPVVFCCPVTQSLKERFRFFGDLLNIPDARSVLFRLRLA